MDPQLPPSGGKRKRSDEDADDRDINRHSSIATTSSKQDRIEADEGSSKMIRVVGPTLPSSVNVETSQGLDASDSSSGDEDDDFGPSLPTAASSVAQRTPPTATAAASSSNGAAPLQSQRDEWMTLAPSSGDWSQRIDPTKLKNRKFNTSKSSAIRSAGTDSWHETPEQKQARLQREVLGVKDRPSTPASKPVASKQENSSDSERMKDSTSQRGPSLYDAHQQGKRDEQDDDPSARAFDREKDIAGATQLNGTQRREMLKKSSNFNSRFSSAKYL